MGKVGACLLCEEIADGASQFVSNSRFIIAMGRDCATLILMIFHIKSEKIFYRRWVPVGEFWVLMGKLNRQPRDVEAKKLQLMASEKPTCSSDKLARYH